MSEEMNQILNEPTYFALILRGKYKDFLELKKILETLTNARLIYQRVSPHMMWVVEQKPTNFSSRNNEEKQR